MPSGSAMMVEEKEEEEEALMIKEDECDTEKEFFLRGKRWVQTLDDRFMI